MNFDEFIKTTKEYAKNLAAQNEGRLKGILTKQQMATILCLSVSALTDILRKPGMGKIIKAGGGKGMVYIPLETAFQIIDTYFQEG